MLARPSILRSRGLVVASQALLLGAVLSAVYVHGLSGDIAASKVGEKALTAGDLIKFLPSALKSLEPS